MHLFTKKGTKINLRKRKQIGNREKNVLQMYKCGLRMILSILHILMNIQLQQQRCLFLHENQCGRKLDYTVSIIP